MFSPSTRELLLRVKQRFAAEYSNQLRAGDKILVDVDWKLVGQVFHLIPGCLEKRGLGLESIGPAGWIVVERPVAPDNVFASQPTPVECSKCHGSWWECEHVASLTFALFEEADVQRHGRGVQA